jgi:hypothetical protein
MTPNLSAELYQQGFLTKKEALWYYGKDGRPVPNVSAMFDENGEPNF